MTETSVDATLVAAHLAGGRDALAQIYDRYADALYDTAAAMLGDRHEAADVTQDVFVMAAERLGQLRDHTKLKPWLFAILRNEVYRKTRRRKRTVLTDFTSPEADVAADDQITDTALLEHRDLAELVRSAAGGLEPRDQLVMELSVRQGLEGAELAEALGVSTQQSYGLVHRMRDRTERSLTAYCVARAGRKDCPELDNILGAWDGEFTVLIRKRVARHIDHCDTCERSRRKLAPVALLRAAPALAAPPDLRERVLGAVARGAGPSQGQWHGTDSNGFPRVRGNRRSARWLAASAAVVVILLVSLAIGVTARDDGPTAPTDSNDLAGDNVAPTTVDGPAPSTNDPQVSPAAGSVPADVPQPWLEPVGTTPPPVSTPPLVSPPPLTGPPVAAPPVAAPPAGAPPAGVPPETAVAPVVSTPPTQSATTVPPPVAGFLVLGASSVDFGSVAGLIEVALSNPGGQPVNWSMSNSPAPFGISPANGTLQPGQTIQLRISVSRDDAAEGTVSALTAVTAPGLTPTPLALAATVNRPPIITLATSPPRSVCFNSTGALVMFSAIVSDESPVVVRLVTIDPGGTQRTEEMTGSPHSASVVIDDPRSGLGTWSWQIEAVDDFGNAANASGFFVTTVC